MERNKKWWGWHCVLAPYEVLVAKNDLILRPKLKQMTIRPDGTASFNVFLLHNYFLMEFVIEGLSEYGISTVNLYPTKDHSTEIIEKEF